MTRTHLGKCRRPVEIARIPARARRVPLSRAQDKTTDRFRDCQRSAFEDGSAARTVTVTFVPFVKWPSSPTARITYVPGSLKCTVVVALPVRSVPAGLIDVVIGSNVTLPGPR